MLPPICIGPLRLASPLLLAPIAGFTDLAYRLVVRSCGGVGLCVTDLLCPEGLLRQNYRSMKLAATHPDDHPLSMQLYGGDACRMAEAARWCEDRGADVIDINMGCPVDKVTKLDGGSKLLCDPDNTLRLVEKVRAALRRVPLTCKLRLGWDDSSIVAPYLAARLEEAGVAMIAVHGRTAAMRFSGTVRLEGIAEVVAAVKRIPVVGNGDVRGGEEALRMVRATGCRGVMIGREAVSRPWVFAEALAALEGRPAPPEPSLSRKVDLMRRHFVNHVEFRGEHAAVCEFRKRISWYAKTLHPCSDLKERMRTLRSADEFHRLVDEFLARREGESVRPACEEPASMEPVAGAA